jgi:hypothetical protein
LTQADTGVRLERGKVTLLQGPAPLGLGKNVEPAEILLLLHDLSLLSAAAAGQALPPLQPVAAGQLSDAREASAASGASLALGCGLFFVLIAWLGGTYVLARTLGMAAAMVAFFVPPLALAIWAIMIAVGGPAREVKVERAIREEAAGVLALHAELLALQKKGSV